MTMAQQFDAKTRAVILASACAVPLSIDPDPVTDRDERLTVIIRNLERHNAAARQNIITQGYAVLSTSNSIPNDDTMDTAPDPPLTSTTSIISPPTQIELNALFASLAAPHDRSKGDIYALKPRHTTPNTSAANPALSTNPAVAAKPTTDDPRINALLRDFDAHAEKTMYFYRSALARRTGDPAPPAPAPATGASATRTMTAAASARPNPPSRSGSTSGAAAPLRDPRRDRPPSRSGGWDGDGRRGSAGDTYRPSLHSRSGSTSAQPEGYKSGGESYRPAPPSRQGSTSGQRDGSRPGGDSYRPAPPTRQGSTADPRSRPVSRRRSTAGQGQEAGAPPLPPPPPPPHSPVRAGTGGGNNGHAASGSEGRPPPPARAPSASSTVDKARDPRLINRR